MTPRRRLAFAFIAAVASALLLRWSLTPPSSWTYNAEGRILLDRAELEEARHPPFFAGLNFVLRHVLPATWAYLVPLDEAYLVAAAKAKAAAEGFGLEPGADDEEIQADAACWLTNAELLADDDETALPPRDLAPDSARASCREGLRQLLRDMHVGGPAQTEGQTPLGRFMFQRQMISALANNLKVRQLVRRSGGERDRGVLGETIDRPIIIVGGPRTGTTFLHRALSVHPQARMLPYYEALDTIAPAALPPASFGALSAADANVGAGAAGAAMADNRAVECNYGMQLIHLLRPLFKGMMVMGPDVVFEDMQLSGHCMSTLLFESSLGNTPNYSRWYRQTDQTFGYRCIRLFLKAIQYQRRGGGRREGKARQDSGGDGGGGGGGAAADDDDDDGNDPARSSRLRPHRWILKTPQHAEKLDVIHRVFPDAKVVLTYRDPVDILRSLLPLTAYALGVQNDRVDLARHGEHWASWLHTALAHQRAHAHLFPDAVEARFDGWIRSTDATMVLLTEICERAGLAASPEALAPIRAFVEGEQAAQQGGSRARFAYDLSVFGLEEDALRERFGWAKQE